MQTHAAAQLHRDATGWSGFVPGAKAVHGETLCRAGRPDLDPLPNHRLGASEKGGNPDRLGGESLILVSTDDNASPLTRAQNPVPPGGAKEPTS